MIACDEVTNEWSEVFLETGGNMGGHPTTQQVLAFTGNETCDEMERGWTGGFHDETDTH